MGFVLDLRRSKQKEKRRHLAVCWIWGSKRDRDGESDREKGCVWYFRSHVMINAPVAQTRMHLVRHELCDIFSQSQCEEG